MLLFIALAAADAPPDSDIFLADLDLAHGRVGAPRNLTDRIGYDNQPAFLPDGSGFLYVADVDGPTDVFRYTFATGVERADSAAESPGAGPGASGTITRVTTTPEAEFSPTPLASGFSAVRVAAPDGDVEVYTESQQVWRYDDAGRAVENLLPDVRRVGYHAWLDKRRLALIRVGPGGEGPNPLVFADLRKGTVVPIAPDAGRSLIPTKKGLLFVDKHDAARWVVARVKGARVTELVATPPNAPGEPEDARSEDLRVLPDGSILMAHGTRLLRWNGGKDWETLADLPDLGGAIKRLTLSPDGTKLLFVVQR